MQPPSDTRRRRWAREIGIAEIARRQHGVVSHLQLVGAGLGARAITYRVALGHLHPLHRGVYAVGHRSLARTGTWMAAVLSCGEGAVLSHRSAGALWRLTPGHEVKSDVTTPRRPRALAGLRPHQGTVRARYATTILAIPVTTVPLTLIDLGAVVSAGQLQRAVNQNDILGLATRAELADSLRDHRGRRGVARLRAVIDLGAMGPVRSELERRFLNLVREAGLPAPETGVEMRLDSLWLESDCLWRKPRVIVELDGRAFHDTTQSFERDRARDRALAAAGWQVVRVTWTQLHDGPEQLLGDLRRLLSRRM